MYRLWWMGDEEGQGWHFVLIRDSVIKVIPEINTKFTTGVHNGKEGLPTFCSVIRPYSEADFTFNNIHS